MSGINMPYSALMHTQCKSDLGHKLLYGLDEYFNHNRGLDNSFFLSLARGSACQTLFHDNTIETCIGNVMTYIKHGGKFKGLPDIDCARFFLRALEVLTDASDHPLIYELDFWEGYGHISKWAYRHIKDIDHISFLKSVLTPLLKKFQTVNSWIVRSYIIQAFRLIADYAEEHDHLFWQFTDSIYKYCKGSVELFEQGEAPANIKGSVANLTDLWRTIATKHGKDPLVRKKTSYVATGLFGLINDCQLSPTSGIYILKDALMDLKLPTVDFLTGKKLKRSPEVAYNLALLGDKLLLHQEEAGNVHNKANIADILSNLLPYLWGSKGKRDRRVPLEDLNDAIIAINNDSGRAKFAAKICDICAGSYRGINVEIDTIAIGTSKIVKNTSKDKSRLLSKTLKFHKKDENKIIDAKNMVLRMPYKAGIAIRHINLPCKIVNAKNTASGTLKLVLYSSPTAKRTLPKLWKEYIDGLPVPIISVPQGQ